jgi:tetratricopeptide (TPR) repeat protein
MFVSCGQFTYKTYSENQENATDDPEPDYTVTLNNDFQNYSNFMFLGNRIENFGTYFNTYFNAKENFDDAYEDYATRVLANYSERLDSIYINPPLSQESIDKFNKAIEKASKVIQFHKSSAYMDRAVLLIGKTYFYLGDYLKAERKFSEFISKLSRSPYLDEAVLFLSRTQLRLGNQAALERLENLIKNTGDKSIKALAYQTLAEYYINRKDYESAIVDYRKSVEYSSDDEFRAQMQYLIASVLSRKDPTVAASEYKKVLDYGTSFDLEYYSRLNYAKNLILSGNFNEASSLLQQLKVKYKDNEQFQSDIDLLKARYYEQRKEYKKALDGYKSVIKNYPKTVSAADAAYYIAGYHENVLNDYLNAYRYYKFSYEQNAASHYASKINSKTNTFRRYFELKSVVTGSQVKTDYSDEIIKLMNGKIETEKKQEQQKGDEGEKKEKSKGQGFSSLNLPIKDSLNFIDSAKIKEQKMAAAQFELAELFLYELNRGDSAEFYFLESFAQSPDYDFKGKVLYALADLYSNQNRSAQSEETLRKIIREFPLSPVANAARHLLNLPMMEEVSGDAADSIYTDAELKFSNDQYNAALNNFTYIINNYPSSKHFSRSVYAVGWIYENVLANPDSAFAYYERVLAADPKSDFAKIVADKVTEYKKSLSPPDSSNQIDSTKLNKENPKEGIEKKEKIIKEEDKAGDITKPDEMKKEESPDATKKK